MKTLICKICGKQQSMIDGNGNYVCDCQFPIRNTEFIECEYDPKESKCSYCSQRGDITLRGYTHLPFFKKDLKTGRLSHYCGCRGWD